jgi:hypothetical protein
MNTAAEQTKNAIAELNKKLADLEAQKNNNINELNEKIKAIYNLISHNNRRKINLKCLFYIKNYRLVYDQVLSTSVYRN